MLLNKQTVTRLVNKFRGLDGTERFITISQASDIGSYSERNEPSLYPPNLLNSDPL
jgi:hypothetical protein